MNVYYWKIAGIRQMDLQPWTGIISEERLRRAKRFHQEKDQIRCLCAEILLRYGLAQAGVQKQDIRFRYQQSGKPFLEGNHLPYFSISHSGDYVMCAIASEEIGVDVEQCTDIHSGLAKSVMTSAEYAHYLNLRPNMQNQYFFTVWTCKESVVKCIGTGLQTSFPSIEIVTAGKKTQAVKDGKEIYHLWRIPLGGAYCSAVCMKHEKSVPKVIFVDTEQL